MGHRLFREDCTVLDYGCGRGEDVCLLRKDGLKAEGWGPHFRPEGPIKPADVVNLGYVLNVIENPAERTETLRKAHALALRTLVVAVRVDQSLDTPVPGAEPGAPPAISELARLAHESKTEAIRRPGLRLVRNSRPFRQAPANLAEHELGDFHALFRLGYLGIVGLARVTEFPGIRRQRFRPLRNCGQRRID